MSDPHKSGSPLLTVSGSPDIQRNFELLGRDYTQQPTPQACAHRTSSLAIAAGTPVFVPFHDTRWNEGNLWTASDPTRLTAPVTGLYSIGAALELDVGSGDFQVLIRVNGGDSLVVQSQGPMSAGLGHQVDVHRLWRLAASDYVELRVFNTTAGNLTAPLPYQSDFWMVRLSGYVGQQYTK